MTELAVLERALKQVLWDLRPYLNDLVVIGGWVPHLYRRYGGFARWHGRLSLTSEVDVLVDRPFPTEGRPAIPELLRRAGFTPNVEAPTCAVWANEPERGEMVEFLVPHRGTATQLGRPVPVPEQRGMAAIPLAGLELLREHTQTLSIPVASAEHGSLDVRVPTLGAYVVNKASTFSRRGARMDERDNPKLAKDLLYLRDLFAAGGEVVEAVTAGIEEVAASRTGRSHVGDAESQLGLALKGPFRPRLADVAAMLSERDGLAPGAALADMEGHLTDLHEILHELARKPVKRRRN